MPANAKAPRLLAGTGSPFARLRRLLDGIAPGAAPIDLTIGGPRHPFPDMVGEVLQRNLQGFGSYPPADGTASFRKTVADWLNRRYRLARPVDADTMILPLAGSREGLFLVAALVSARARERGIETPAIAIPNPFYQTYASAALAAGAEPVYVAAGRETGFLPDFGTLKADQLKRLAAIYLCSPANPQGAVADRAYWRDLVALCRRHGAVAVADECYSEIYRTDPVPGVLEAAGEDFSDLLSFNSLSKRSSLPGLRVGFVAGDAALVAPFFSLRNVAAPTVPLPLLAVAEAVWKDEAHVAENRRLYNEKFDRASAILGNRFGYETPPGGFFLWLDMSGAGGGEAAAARLWEEAGVRVLPGSYLTQAAEGPDPGGDFIRVALVGSVEETEEALTRLAGVFG